MPPTTRAQIGTAAKARAGCSFSKAVSVSRNRAKAAQIRTPLANAPALAKRDAIQISADGKHRLASLWPRRFPPAPLPADVRIRLPRDTRLHTRDIPDSDRCGCEKHSTCSPGAPPRPRASGRCGRADRHSRQMSQRTWDRLPGRGRNERRRESFLVRVRALMSELKWLVYLAR